MEASSTVLKSGLLQKKNSRGSYQTRHMIVTSQAVIYARSEAKASKSLRASTDSTSGDVNDKRVMPLASVEPVLVNGGDFVLMLGDGKKRDRLTLRASDAQTATEWVDTIIAAKSGKTSVSPPEGSKASSSPTPAAKEVSSKPTTAISSKNTSPEGVGTSIGSDGASIGDDEKRSTASGTTIGADGAQAMGITVGEGTTIDDKATVDDSTTLDDPSSVSEPTLMVNPIQVQEPADVAAEQGWGSDYVLVPTPRKAAADDAEVIPAYQSQGRRDTIDCFDDDITAHLNRVSEKKQIGMPSMLR